MGGVSRRDILASWSQELPTTCRALRQSRYRARVVDSDENFRQVIAHVHLNPVSAGMADDPADFVYRRHREIIGVCRPHLIDLRTVLLGFSGGTHRAVVAWPYDPGVF
jgi:hypothetical protein